MTGKEEAGRRGKGKEGLDKGSMSGRQSRIEIAEGKLDKRVTFKDVEKDRESEVMNALRKQREEFRREVKRIRELQEEWDKKIKDLEERIRGIEKRMEDQEEERRRWECVMRDREEGAEENTERESTCAEWLSSRAGSRASSRGSGDRLSEYMSDRDIEDLKKMVLKKKIERRVTYC